VLFRSTDAEILALNIGEIAMTPYAEKDLVNYETTSMKINASLYYLLDDNGNFAKKE
jgi:hypothetical protein